MFVVVQDSPNISVTPSVNSCEMFNGNRGSEMEKVCVLMFY